MQDVIEMILLAEDLPTPPGVALRLLELYNQPSVEVKEMAMVISTDPVLTAKLIEYCNSPLLARENVTSSVNQAIVVIGMRAVKILALSFSLVQTVSNTKTGFDYDQFWSQSLATAVVAKTIGATRNGDGNQEFLVGLMLNIGQVGLAHTFPSRYAEFLETSQSSGVSIRKLEVAEWGASHIDVGAALLKHWNFPAATVEAVESFAQSANQDEELFSEQTKILKLTQQIVKMLFTEDLRDEEVEKTKAMASRWFDVSAERFSEIFDEANAAWIEFAVLLSFDSSNAQTFEQLERRALKGIAQLSIGLHAENTAITQENAELKINALVDSLTGLKNRRSYDEEVMAEWERSMRKNRPFVLMMVDIDHFKSVNDTYGHGIGDRALFAVGNALRGNARQYDSVYRFGGEEFVVMVAECEAEFAFSAAERYRKAIEQLAIKLEDGSTLKITASIGVAVHVPGTAGTKDDLLSEADDLLYRAKKAGRNRVCCNVNSADPRLANPASIDNPLPTGSPNQV